MNLVEWLLYAAACAWVREHKNDDRDVERSSAATVVTSGAEARGFKYRPGLLYTPATAHACDLRRLA